MRDHNRVTTKWMLSLWVRFESIIHCYYSMKYWRNWWHRWWSEKEPSHYGGDTLKKLIAVLGASFSMEGEGKLLLRLCKGWKPKIKKLHSLFGFTYWLIFGMEATPFLCRDPFFTKITYHRNVSLVVYLPIFYFSFCQKKLHLYKQARLPSLLFTFSDDLVSKYTLLNHYSAIPRNEIIAC